MPRHVHLVGAGGAGLSGAALHLLAQGHVLSGQDLAHSDFVDDLCAAGVPVTVGPSTRAGLPATAEVLVHSAAVPPEDEQRREAERRGLPILLYAELLARIAAPARTLAVAGTHGKTTTGWMLFHALRGAAPAAPGALIGGRHRGLGRGALAPAAQGWCVLEACEYDRTFLRLSPFAAIVTNVEPDHLDVYGDLAAVEKAFAEFVARVDPGGLLVVGAEVPEQVSATARCEVWRLGRELRLEMAAARDGCARGRLAGPGFESEFELRVPGEFNAWNASLALGLAAGLEGRTSAVARAAAADLALFEGAARRFEPWGQVASGAQEILVVHDYAHHPTEVAATLAAARAAHPRRSLTVLFQPHQASRTAHFLEGFVEALGAADSVVVADVYGARKEIDARVAGATELVAGLTARGTRARAGGAPREACQVLLEEASGGALLLVLGAGDIDTIRADLLAGLRRRFERTGPVSSHP